MTSGANAACLGHALNKAKAGELSLKEINQWLIN